MTFPFSKQSQHKIYKNTFLQCVYLFVEYPKKESVFFNDGYYERLKEYFSNHFPGTSYDEEKARRSDLIKLESRSDGVAITLKNGLLMVMVDKRRYRSFVDNVLPLIFRTEALLREVLQVDSLKQAMLKKINFWLANQNTPANSSFDYAKLEKLVLSANILSDTSSRVTETTDQNGQQMVWKKTFEGKDGKQVHVIISHVQPSNAPAKGCLVLDSDVTLPSVSTNDLQKQLLEANDLLYDAFHWTVSDQVLSFMSKDIQSEDDTTK